MWHKYWLQVSHILLPASPVRLSSAQNYLPASARVRPVFFSDEVSDNGPDTFVVGGNIVERAVACCMPLRAVADMWVSCSGKTLEFHWRWQSSQR